MRARLRPRRIAEQPSQEDVSNESVGSLALTRKYVAIGWGGREGKGISDEEEIFRVLVFCFHFFLQSADRQRAAEGAHAGDASGDSSKVVAGHLPTQDVPWPVVAFGVGFIVSSSMFSNQYIHSRLLVLRVSSSRQRVLAAKTLARAAEYES